MELEELNEVPESDDDGFADPTLADPAPAWVDAYEM